MNCRHCHQHLKHLFLDLGFAPPSNAYLVDSDLHKPERYYPLKILVCDSCWLVQTEDYARPEELFSPEYAYFSSYSTSWMAHAAHYSEMITKRLGLSGNSYVVEVAANDGYLLKNFVAAGIPCLGIEPTASTAAAAEKLGVPIMREFFGERLAERLVRQGRQADLIVANNVLAHVPDINAFAKGLKTLLKPGGTITLEFHHLMKLLEHTLFDTVYHEHFSYLSLYSTSLVLARAGLRIFEVEQFQTQGGSLRVYACHADDARVTHPSVAALLEEEASRGMRTLDPYLAFQARVDRVKDDLLMFLIEQKRAGKHVAAYGAAAKGCTLLNYAGVRADLLPYVCDAAPSKQGKYLPGAHLPILSPEALGERKPDIVLILPWNISDEVTGQLAHVRDWGGQFVVAVPEVRFV